MNIFKGECKGVIDNQIVISTDDEDIIRYFKEHTGIPLKIETKKWIDKRTLAQNALYWACIYELALKMRIDKELTHLMMLRDAEKPETLEIRKETLNLFKEQWRTFEIVGETENKYIVNAYYGSHLMDKEEFAHLLDVTINNMDDCGIKPPSKEMKEYLDALQN